MPAARIAVVSIASVLLERDIEYAERLGHFQLAVVPASSGALLGRFSAQF